VLLATTLEMPSLYANPKQVGDAKDVARKLMAVLPDLNRDELLSKLSSDRSFVWIKRQLTPEQQFEVNKLGIPGLQFETEHRRLYPKGSVTAHVVVLPASTTRVSLASSAASTTRLVEQRRAGAALHRRPSAIHPQG